MGNVYNEIYHDLCYQEEYDKLIDEIAEGKRVPCSDTNCTGIINEELECGICGKYIDYDRDNREMDKIAYIFSVARKRNISVRNLIDSIEIYGIDKNIVLTHLENLCKITQVVAISQKYGRDATSTIDMLNFDHDTKDRVKKVCENNCIQHYINRLRDKNYFFDIDIRENIKLNTMSGYKRLSFLISFVVFLISIPIFIHVFKRNSDIYQLSLFWSLICSILTYLIVRLSYWVLDGFNMFKNMYVKIY